MPSKIAININGGEVILPAIGINEVTIKHSIRGHFVKFNCTVEINYGAAGNLTFLTDADSAKELMEMTFTENLLTGN